MFPLPISWREWPAGKPGWRVVDAEIVDVAPHLAMIATFAVHKNPEPWYGQWTVTNVETGLRINFGKSKLGAVVKAREILLRKSVQQVVATLRKGNAMTRAAHAKRKGKA